MVKKTIIFLLLIFFISPALASNPFKWQICGSVNLTAGACDDYWEEFKVYMGIPNTTAVNTTGGLNASEIEGKYWNKTQIQEQFLNKSEVARYLSELNQSLKDTNGSNLEEKLLQMRTEINGDIQDLKNGDNTDSTSKGIGDNTIIIIIVGAIVLVGVFLFMNRQNRNPYADVSPMYQASYPQSFARTHVPKIQSKKNLDLEQQLRELKEKVEKTSENPGLEEPEE